MDMYLKIISANFIRFRCSSFGKKEANIILLESTPFIFASFFKFFVAYSFDFKIQITLFSTFFKIVIHESNVSGVIL